MWKPIKTAPKDGTPVDLWAVSEHKEGTRFPNCAWKRARMHTTDPAESWQGLPRNPLGWKATHWMPIPAPPSHRPPDPAVPPLNQAQQA